jgi:hypothetical protein
MEQKFGRKQLHSSLHASKQEESESLSEGQQLAKLAQLND